jgi:hypothetical protein
MQYTLSQGQVKGALGSGTWVGASKQMAGGC